MMPRLLPPLLPCFLLLVLLFPFSLQADFEINPGLSGSWHDPAVDGQGLLVDVVESQSNLFVAWFAFSHAPPVADARDHQRWYTMFGPYAGNIAQMTLYSVTGGQLDIPLDVNTSPTGQATLTFHSCTSATLDYAIDEPAVSGSIALERLSPDVFCQEIANEAPASDPDYNLPPWVDAVSVVDTGGVLAIGFDLGDPESDLLDVQVDAIGPGDQRYRIPEAHLDGNSGYPVVPGEMRTINWHYGEDAGFAALAWSQVEIEVVADDRYVANLQEIVDLVSTDRLVEDVEFMQGVRHHSANPAHLEATREYLRSEMEARDLPVENQLFNWAGSQGVNIIATLEAMNSDGSYFIIDGHYDTVTTTPGADDNASGTAGMLEAMRVLSQFNTEISIRFIGFDKEELGLRGARHYAANMLPGENVRGMINFEMIGYTCRGEPECVNFPNADTSIYNIRSSFATAMSDVFNSVGATHVPGLKIVPVFDDGDSNFRRSDHAPFWDRGVDALFIADGANFRTPHYHQPSDLIGTMDLEFMTQIVKTAVGTLATVAGISHRGSARSQPTTLGQ